MAYPIDAASWLARHRPLLSLDAPSRPAGAASVGRRAACFAASLLPALGLEFGVRLRSVSLTARLARVAQLAEDARLLAARVGHHEPPDQNARRRYAEGSARGTVHDVAVD
jgi:hypothetical protein